MIVMTQKKQVKIVSEGELSKYLKDGWECKILLSRGEAVIEKQVVEKPPKPTNIDDEKDARKHFK